MPYLGKQPASVPVTADDIPNDSITTAKIVDAAITIADIGPNAVGSSEMADDAVGLNELSATGTTNTSTFLRGDNSWAVPPDNNTVYTHPNHSGEVTSTADGAQVIADNVVDEANLKISNSPTNGQFLSAQSGNTGGLTWAAVPATDISGKLNLSGGTMTNNLTLADNVRLNAGNTGDMIIFHDHSNQQNKILSASLPLILGGPTVSLNNGASDENMLVATQDGSVDLYHNHVKKFETTSAGITAQGRLEIQTANDANTHLVQRMGSTAGSYGYADFELVTPNSTATNLPRLDMQIGNANILSLCRGGNVGIGVTSPAAKLDLGNTTSNTVGGTETLRMGEQAFRLMTGGENAVMCLDRDNAGGDKKIMQSWNPDSGSVAIGNTTPVAAGMLAIKPTSETQAQLKLMGGNYSYGTELQSQNGSEGGTVGNTRQFFKIEHVTLGSTRTMYTTSSQVGTDTHKWETQNLTRMFLNNTGKLDLYTSSGNWNMQMYAGGTGSQSFLDFRLQNNSQVGYIVYNGSSVVYSTSSDYRLKENVDYTWDATTRLKQLKPARFNFIADDTNTLVDGFLAHEVSSIVPEAVTGEKDAMTAEVLYVEADDLPEGKSVGDVKEASVPDMQGIDQSKLVPLLVKAMQEQQTTIESLTARITALEG